MRLMLQSECEHKGKLRSSKFDLYIRDGNCKQRLAGRTLKREGRSACLDRRHELGAVCLADGDDWDRYFSSQSLCACFVKIFCCNCSHSHDRASVSVVVDNDSCRSGGLRMHCLLDKVAVATHDQHNLPGGVRIRQLGRAVQRIGQDNLSILVLRTDLLRSETCQ